MAKQIIAGTDLHLSFQGKFIGCSTSNSFSSSVAMRDAACKEAGNFYTGVPGMFTATISTDGLVIVDDPVDAEAMRAAEIFALHMAGTLIDWEFGTDTVGHTKLTGKGYITRFDLNGADSDNGTYTCEVQVVDEYSQVPVTA